MQNDHKVGRPFRANSPSISITIRLTPDELAAVESHVEKRGEPRAVIIREAMETAGLFTPVRKRGS